ncbi:MAG: hypothetical protein ACO1QS_01910 [Verrucomicrobiota bacterium]
MRFGRQHLFIVMMLWLNCQQTCFAQPARQLANFQPEDAGYGSSLPFSTGYSSTAPYDFAVVNGIGYFAAEDAIHGEELWRTDGTPEGTWMVADINTGWPSSGPKRFMAGESLVYFVGSGPYGQRLFRSDGTATGTFPVRDELPRGPANELNRALLGVVDDQLYFAAAANGDYDFELWTTDGTRAGTRQVKNLAAAGAGVMFPEQAAGGGAALGNRFFYSANNGVEGYHLWETDGTAAGTRQLKNLVPPGKLGGLTGDWVNGYPQNFLAADGLVYFTAISPVDGREWWRTDGTPEGTYMLPQFAPERPAHDEAGFSSISEANHAITLGNYLFYSARRFDSQGLNYAAVPALAVSDGTAAGTRLLRENLEIQFMLTKSAGKVWFIARDRNAISDPEHHYGLWSATAEECHFVTSVRPYSRLMAVGDTLYGVNPVGGLLAVDAVTEQVLYGGAVWNTMEETWSVPAPLLAPSGAAAADHDLKHFAAVGARLFFSRHTPENGLEPWITDGTPAGTHLLQDIYKHPEGIREMSGPMFLGTEGIVYFPVGATSLNLNLVRFEPGMGSPETVPGYYVSSFGGYGWGTELDGSIICALTPVVDGETAPSQLHIIRGDVISALVPATGAEYLNSPFGFTRSGNNVFFFAYSASDELSLWRTSGTTETTVKVKTWSDYEGRDWSIPGTIVISGDRIYFPVFYISSTELSQNNYELFSSDGTAVGTYSFATVPTLYAPVSGASFSVSLLPLGNGVLFFRPVGYWYNDGTPEGTVPFNLFAGQTITSMRAVAGQIWYTVLGSGLWRTDGTPEGTHAVSSTITSLVGGAEFQSSIYLYNGGGIYVIAHDFLSAQPVFVADPENFGGIYWMTATEDHLYFSVSDSLHGVELWRTDGTLKGITFVQDIWPGSMPSDVANLRQVGANIFFTATDHRGREPWIMPVQPALPAKVENPGSLVTITGKAFHFQPVIASGSVQDWHWRNLPPGLSYHQKSGVISGVPQMGGLFQVTSDAASSGGTGVMSFTLHVIDPDYARISLAPAAAAGKFSLSLDAIAGLRYQILTSTDLINWSTLTSDAEAGLFIPELSVGGDRRFFKVLTTEPVVNP